MQNSNECFQAPETNSTSLQIKGSSPEKNGKKGDIVPFWRPPPLNGSKGDICCLITDKSA